MSAPLDELAAVLRQAYLDVAAMTWDAAAEGTHTKTDWLVTIAQGAEPLVLTLTAAVGEGRKP